MELILGSKSPRRREILNFFSLPFRQIESHFDESLIPFNKPPGPHAQELAEAKAKMLSATYPKAVCLTADTIVHFQGQSLLKPKNLDEARLMLRKLSNQMHEVYTGVAITAHGQLFSEAELTRVFFCELTDSEIDRYIAAFHPFDKAGGYAIQGAGSMIVKRIEGCYYNVMGLPLQTVRRLLKRAIGVDLWDYFKSV